MREEVAILLVLIIVVSSLLGLVALVLRHKRQVRDLLSKERLAALDKGVEIPWEVDLRRPRRTHRLHLKAGVVLAGAGAGLLAASGLVLAPDQRVVMAWGVFFGTLGAASILYDVLVGRREWERTAELDEALTRAYIRRLEGPAAPAASPAAEPAADR
jgi:hypothetical protein